MTPAWPSCGVHGARGCDSISPQHGVRGAGAVMEVVLATWEGRAGRHEAEDPGGGEEGVLSLWNHRTELLLPPQLSQPPKGLRPGTGEKTPPPQLSVPPGSVVEEASLSRHVVRSSCRSSWKAASRGVNTRVHLHVLAYLEQSAKPRTEHAPPHPLRTHLVRTAWGLEGSSASVVSPGPRHQLQLSAGPAGGGSRPPSVPGVSSTRLQGGGTVKGTPGAPKRSSIQTQKG